MKKNLIEEIDRMRSLISAKHGIIKPFLFEVLKEQNNVEQMGRGKEADNPDVLYDENFYDLRDDIKKKYETKNPNLNAQLNELKSNPAYKLLMEKLDNEDKKIFYAFLTQKSRLEFLKITLNFLQSFTKKRKLQKELEKNPNYTGVNELYGWNADILVGDQTKQVIEVKLEDDFEIKEYQIPLDVAGQTVYKDNSTEPDAALITAIDEWVEELKSTIEFEKQDNEAQVIVECTKIDIASSCSRLRNTGEVYEGKTWNQLSKDRAERVYTILVSKLQELGVVLSPSIQKILRGGFNGDGTSGPDPSKSFTLRSGKRALNMSYSKTGAEKLSGPDEKRFGADKYDGLLKSSQESDKYKFCIAMADIIIKVRKSDQPDPLKPSTLYYQGYSIVLNPEYKPIKYKKLKNKKGRYRHKGGNGGGGTKTRQPFIIFKKLVNCPAYN
jgi:hypothetical protein